MLVLPVYKSHRVLFTAGRDLELVDIGHGWFLLPQAVEADIGGGTAVPRPERVLPEGWSSRNLSVGEDLVLDLPYPARVVIFVDGSIFHGPVRLDAGRQPSDRA